MSRRQRLALLRGGAVDRLNGLAGELIARELGQCVADAAGDRQPAVRTGCIVSLDGVTPPAEVFGLGVGAGAVAVGIDVFVYRAGVAASGGFFEERAFAVEL